MNFWGEMSSNQHRSDGCHPGSISCWGPVGVPHSEAFIFLYPAFSFCSLLLNSVVTLQKQVFGWQTVYFVLMWLKLQALVSRKRTTSQCVYTRHSVRHQDMKVYATNDLLLQLLYANYGGIGLLGKIQDTQLNLNFR